MIDWQLEYTFDNSLRFSIYRLGYSTLFMSTPVCSSACRRYEPLTVAVTLSYFAVFSYYMYWLIYSGSHLHILVSFYPSLLCLYAFCIFPLQVLQQFILPLHAHLAVVFSEVSQQHFWHFLQQFLIRHFVVDFLHFSSSDIICCTHVLFIPTWYISTSGSYITCIYTDNLYCSLIYCSNFLMV